MAGMSVGVPMADKSGARGTDTIFGGVSLVIALALFVHTFSDQYDVNQLFGDVSTVFVPRALLILWMVCSVVIVARDNTGLAAFSEVRWGAWARVAVVTAVTTAAIWAFGFLYVMPVGTFALGWAFGYRRWGWLALVSIAGPLAVWLILGVVAAVPLPTARLF